MKRFVVTVKAVITQAIPVEAENRMQAAEIALSLFDVDELENETGFLKSVSDVEELKCP